MAKGFPLREWMLQSPQSRPHLLRYTPTATQTPTTASLERTPAQLFQDLVHEDGTVSDMTKGFPRHWLEKKRGCANHEAVGTEVVHYLSTATCLYENIRNRLQKKNTLF